MPGHIVAAQQEEEVRQESYSPSATQVPAAGFESAQQEEEVRQECHSPPATQVPAASCESAQKLAGHACWLRQ